MGIFKKEKREAIAPEELVKRVRELEKQVADMRQGISKVGVVRFNPFKGVGGNQSFSIALLDQEHNGVVMTSYYGRELNRVYAKPVRNEESEYELAAEEKEAIAQAIGSKNQKPKRKNQNDNEKFEGEYGYSNYRK